MRKSLSTAGTTTSEIRTAFVVGGNSPIELDLAVRAVGGHGIQVAQVVPALTARA